MQSARSAIIGMGQNACQEANGWRWSPYLLTNQVQFHIGDASCMQPHSTVLGQHNCQGRMAVLEDVLGGDGKLEVLGLVGLVEDGRRPVPSPVHDGDTLLPDGFA